MVGGKAGYAAISHFQSLYTYLHDHDHLRSPHDFCITL